MDVDNVRIGQLADGAVVRAEEMSKINCLSGLSHCVLLRGAAGRRPRGESVCRELFANAAIAPWRVPVRVGRRSKILATAYEAKVGRLSKPNTSRIVPRGVV